MASRKKHSNTAFNILLGLGFVLLTMSFIVEINFHYIQGFTPGVIDDETFWKMENVVASTSTILMIIGILSIIISIYYMTRKPVKKGKNNKK